MISDEAWVDGYITTMRDGLRNANRRLTELLDDGGVPYIPAEAGVFTVLDLRSYLTEQTWEAEHVLWLRILDEARVNLTPGVACHNGEPGFMRLCYAGLPTEKLEVGVRRVVKLLG